jgi:hypothetical protein
MIAGAPAHLDRQRGFRSTTRFEHASSTAPAASSQVVLMVDFTSSEGRTRWAVGLGDTLAEAIAFAQDSCPTDTTWRPTRWNDLYGD